MEEFDDNQWCPITGLAQGPALLRALQTMVDQPTDERWAVYIKLDRIEYINTHFNRDAGDETLQRVAEIIKRTEQAPLFRYAGPVFVMVLTGDTMHALDVSERIRKAVAESTEFLEPMSVSIALVSSDEVAFVDELEDVALARLQIARRRGGDTVCAVSAVDETLDYFTGTVLLVDPEADALGVMIREIESRGFSVITASDGQEALQVVSQIVPDVIISEVTVPKLSGFELRARLRRQDNLAVIPFVLLSHRQNDDLIREAATLRILHYHRKPVSVVLIAELVRNLASAHVRGTEPGCR